VSGIGTRYAGRVDHVPARNEIGGIQASLRGFPEGKFDATRRRGVHARCCSNMRVVRLAAWGLASRKAGEPG
jgi:hypothetical protein